MASLDRQHVDSLDFGGNVEDRLGRQGYLTFYLSGGLVAAGKVVAVQADMAKKAQTKENYYESKN